MDRQKVHSHLNAFSLTIAVSFVLTYMVLRGVSEIGNKISNNMDKFEKNADFGHFRPFLACFWPVMALV